jgi:hypothetical protein
VAQNNGTGNMTRLHHGRRTNRTHQARVVVLSVRLTALSLVRQAAHWTRAAQLQVNQPSAPPVAETLTNAPLSVGSYRKTRVRQQWQAALLLTANHKQPPAVRARTCAATTRGCPPWLSSLKRPRLASLSGVPPRRRLTASCGKTRQPFATLLDRLCGHLQMQM